MFPVTSTSFAQNFPEPSRMMINNIHDSSFTGGSAQFQNDDYTGTYASSPMQLSRITLSSSEVPYYQHLWKLAETKGTGILSGNQGAEFLAQSDLQTPVLRDIWKYADQRNEGQLGFEEFCIACRLVAHAQLGIPITQELIYQEPQMIAQFKISPQTYNSVSDSSSISGQNTYTPPPLGLGIGFNPLASVTAAVTAPSPQAAGSMFPSESSVYASLGGGVLQELPPLTDDMIQKYISVFKRFSLDSAGNLTGESAKPFLSRSGLPETELSQIWSLADKDVDGTLSLSEFIIAMHLICARHRGLALPAIVPFNLELAATNAAVSQPSVPMENIPIQSESSFWTVPLSPFASKTDWSSPTVVTAVEESEEPPKTFFSQDENKRVPTKLENNDSQSFLNFLSSPKGKSKKNKKSFGELVEFERLKPKRESSSSSSSVASSSSLPEPNKLQSKKKEKTTQAITELKKSSRSVPKRTVTTSGDTATEILQAIVTMDKRLASEVRQAVNVLSDKLNSLHGVREVWREKCIKEKLELQRQLERRQEFESQICDLKVEMQELLEERRNTEYEKLSAARDVHHYQDEILFLKQHILDITKDIQHLMDATQMSEKALHLTETQTRQLDVSRKTVLGQIEAYREALKTQESEIYELRLTLEKRRQEKFNVQAKHAVLQEKLRQAEQDRSLLLYSTEAEKIKLDEIQKNHFSSLNEKLQLTQQIADLNQEPWILSRTENTSIPPVMLQSTENQTQFSRRPSALPRDSKGVPAGAVSSSSLLNSSSLYNSSVPEASKLSKFRAQFASVDTVPTTWTSFGGVSRSRHDQFMSTANGAGSLDRDIRGLNRLSNEVKDKTLYETPGDSSTDTPHSKTKNEPSSTETKKITLEVPRETVKTKKKKHTTKKLSSKEGEKSSHTAFDMDTFGSMSKYTDSYRDAPSFGS